MNDKIVLTQPILSRLDERGGSPLQPALGQVDRLHLEPLIADPRARKPDQLFPCAGEFSYQFDADDSVFVIVDSALEPFGRFEGDFIDGLDRRRGLEPYVVGNWTGQARFAPAGLRTQD